MAAIADDLLNLLRQHVLVQNVRVVNYDETPLGKLELKIRCRLAKNYQLQVWLHHEATFQDYAYQLFTDHPILRWDNAPHYPQISTAPHHFHDEIGQVGDSPLSGKPLEDLKIVLAEIEKWLASTKAA
ncbi:MAG: hypothetical protein DPW09_31860 [Anaerolineae bacterium]|nr:hypothetical protein [Anaerolineales bacterium]MCQ3978045.1 hypothetical protein [Anaerolineae bacterium]